MMDRNYPSASAADALAPPAQTGASWAYERGPGPAKPSSSYGTALDGALLQQQNYAPVLQLPTYSAPHIPAAAGTLESSNQAPVTSVMNFLSAIESRSLQAGSVSASLLPAFRPPSWPTGTNTSTTDLYLTSPLPSTATFPSPSAQSSYQHTGAYASRNYISNSSLPLQDPTFSTSTNGLFSHHEHLLHLKASQTVLPTALTFNHLSTPPLGSVLPIQSSTYRSAQESAPHLLQPQFNLHPSGLPPSHGARQSYGATIFSGSIERALQRECSVIKHHQRPSSDHMSSEQLPSTEHSLHGYFDSGGGSDMSYQQDPSCHSPISSSTSTTTDSSRGVSGSPQLKSECVTPTFSSTSFLKAEGSSYMLAPSTAADKDVQSLGLKAGSPEHYSPDEKQDSVIASQQAVQLSRLIADTLPQTYSTPLTHSQRCHPASDKLSSVYTTMSSLPSHSENIGSVRQSLAYSSTSGLCQQQEIRYEAQAQTLCQEGHADRYSSSLSQSGSSFAFSTGSQDQSLVSRSHSFSNSSYPLACVQSLSSSKSTMEYSNVQDPEMSKMSNALPQEQTQSHNVLTLPLSSYSSPQNLQNGITSPVQDSKLEYGKQKPEELSHQNLESLHQASMPSASNNGITSQNVVYVVSKMDEQKLPSVIRSNSYCDEQLMGLNHSNTNGDVKDELLSSAAQQEISLSNANDHQAVSTKSTAPILVPSFLSVCSEQMKLSPLQLQLSALQQQNQQGQSQNVAVQTQFVTVPSNKVLLESSQMILVQQPLVQQTPNTSKLISLQGIQPAHGLGPVHVQYLQMDRDLLGTNIADTQGQQGVAVSESSKNHYVQAPNQQPVDVKNHFALNSICFPDSMLLPDDRTILSNVDDILAATVVACGVTPQDYKATSSTEAEIAAMANPSDPKEHPQTVNMRQLTASFPPAQHSVMGDSHTMSMTPNGVQMTANCQAQAIHESSISEMDLDGDGEKPVRKYSSDGQVFDSNGEVKENLSFEENKSIRISNGEDSSKRKVCVKAGFKPGCAEDESASSRMSKRNGPTRRQNSKGSDVSSPSAQQSPYDGCPQQERIRQKIREVEEKQPEVKTGFIGSFLDFIKSGPKQQYSQSPAKSLSRSRKPSTSSKLGTFPVLPSKVQTLPGPLLHQESPVLSSHQKRLDEDLQKNLETLPSFSSDDEENTGKNQALRNSITSALSSLDEVSDPGTAKENKTLTENQMHTSMVKTQLIPTVAHATSQRGLHVVAPAPTPITASVPEHSAFLTKDQYKATPSGQLAVQLAAVAVEGLTDEELSDSGGEGMYRERDEFVVRNEDIEILKVTMGVGSEPPAIWKVQKALLQKFVPELRDGKRVFSATNSYLGYFGDAKTMYHRVYVKFLDTVNKREYVRVCSRKPRCKPLSSLRGMQVKTLLGLTATVSPVMQNQKPKAKQVKPRAEPPPKKRRKWKEEFAQAATGSSADDDESNPAYYPRFLTTRTMKEAFKSFVELLISVALDADVMAALERANDELLLPHMKRVDGLISESRKRLLHKLHIGQMLKTALDNFPEISVVTELKKDGETPAFKVRLSGKAYNKKTMKPHKVCGKVPQEYTVDQEKTQWFSLYHSLQHYKYHTYLMCKEEIASLQVQTGELGQEATVQKCLENAAWVEGLFDRLEELINQVQRVCR